MAVGEEGAEVRRLDPLTLNLFDEYPADFPPAVTGAEVARELESWFQLERIQLVRLVFPPGEGSGLEIRIPSHHRPDVEETWRFPTRGRDDLVSGTVVHLTLCGFFDLAREPAPIPLAAEASLQLEDGTEVLGFPVACGAGRLAAPYLRVPHGWPSSSFSWPGESNRMCFYWAHQGSFWGREYLRIPPEVCPDGEYEGHIALSPSRSVALGTREFDRYVGEKIQLPVTIEVITASAEWAAPEGPPLPPGS